MRPGAGPFRASLACALLALAWLYHEDAPLRSSVAFHHMAAVRELARGAFPPRHNLVEGTLPQGHYGPYLVLLGTVARWTGAEPLPVLYAAGLVNLLVFALVFRLACRHLVGEAAARWAVLAPLLLWGPWPGPVIEWTAWGWPGTTSLADSQNFFYPQQAGVTLLLLILVLVLRAPEGVPSRRAAPVVVLMISAVLVATHPLTGLAMAPALAALALAEGLRREASRPRIACLLGLPAGALALAALWPYYPVLGLLRAFTFPGMREAVAGIASPSGPLLTATGPPGPLLPPFGVLGPALVGLWGGLVLARCGRPFLLLWALADLLVASFPLLPLRQRFIIFAAMPLQLAAAAVLEGAWARGRLGRVLVVVLLSAGAVSAGQRLRWVLGQEIMDLTFVARLTHPEAVVLSDPRTSNAVAGLTGRKVVAPEGPDVFLVLAGGWQRVVDVEGFLDPRTIAAERERILRTWRATHVLMDRLGHAALDLPYPVVYEGGGYVLYDVRGITGRPAKPSHRDQADGP